MSHPASRIEQLFHRAVELPAKQRAAFLAAECGDDEALRNELRVLLASADQLPSQFLQGEEEPETEGRRGPESTLPHAIDGYRIGRMIGKGGMGIVYEAFQDQPRRSVALKVLRSPLASSELIRRFRKEVDILGQLHHPGIAHIYDAGFASDNDAFPYFAMELVLGPTLTQFCRERAVPPIQRLELTARICDAVHHAHQRGVVHRDLKPGNILVADEETESPDSRATTLSAQTAIAAQPKVLDFGVARLSSGDAEASFQTATGQLLGTLSYMAPEQMSGNPAAIDHRCDVYALGVILYELLSGQVPFDVQRKGVADAIRMVCEEEPTRLTDLVPAVQGDVETIIAKAMDKDPARRYASAAALADDLRRFTRDQPILARPASTWYQLTKFARRNRAVVGATIVAFLALTTGLISAISANLDAREERDAAIRSGKEAEEARAGLARQTEALRDALLEKDRALRRTQGVALLAQSSAMLQSSPSRALALALDGHELAPGPVANRALLQSLRDLRERRVLFADELGVECAAFDSQARRAVTGGRDHVARIWDVTTGELLSELVGHSLSVVTVEFCDDDRKVLTGSWDRTARLWDAETGVEESRFDVPNQMRDMAIDGNVVAFTAVAPRAWLRNLVTGETGTLEGHTASVNSVEFDGEGRILTAGFDGTARIWDVTSRRQIAQLSGHRSQLRDATFSPQRDRIVTCGSDGTVCVHDVASGEVTMRISAHRRTAARAHFLSDGVRFATAGADFTLKLWNALTGHELMSWRGHGDSIQRLDISPDDGTVLSASRDGTARIWDVRAAGHLQLLSLAPGQVTHAMPDATGQRILAGAGTQSQARGGRIWLWNAGGEPAWSQLPAGTPTQSARVNADGTLGVTTGYDGKARVWDLDSGRQLHALDGGTFADRPALVYYASFRPNGGEIALASQDGTASIWDIESGERLHQLTGHGRFVWCAEYSPDGLFVVSGALDSTVRVWDSDSGEQLEVFPQEHAVVRVAFHPDAERMVLSYAESTWSAPASRLKPRYVFLADGTDVFELPDGAMGLAAFNSDGSLLATAAIDGSILLLDAETGEEATRFEGLTSSVSSIYFWREDSELLVASYEGSLIRIPIEPAAFARDCRPSGPVAGRSSPDER